MRKLLSAFTASLLAVAAFAGASRNPAPSPPIPINGDEEAIGDSRGVQEANTTASGAGGTVITFLPVMSNGKLRVSTATANGGIGGSVEREIFQWPRPVMQSSTGTFLTGGGTGGVLNLTLKGGGDGISVGNYITLDSQGLTAPVARVDGTSTVGVTTCNGSACTGNGANTGTYHIDTDLSAIYTGSRAIIFVYKDTKTIAEIAAAKANIVGVVAGTNSAGAGLQYYVIGLKGLTMPGWPYPNYRPNGESTDQPLPLWPCTAANTATCRGYPKVVLALNDFRRGCDQAGTIQNNSADNSSLEAFSFNLLPYSYDSLSPLALPGVKVFDTRHMAGEMDTSSVPAYLSKCGQHPDALHNAPVISFRVSKMVWDWLGPLTINLPSLAVLQTTGGSTAKIVSRNGLMAGTTGTICSAGCTAGTTVQSGASAPTGWAMTCTGCGTGWTINSTINSTGVPADSGAELCVSLNSGGSSAAGAWTLVLTHNYTNHGQSGSYGYADLVSTDILRFSWRDRWTLTSGLVTNITGKVTYSSSQTAASNIGTGGYFSGGSTNPMFFKGRAAYPWADTSHTDYKTNVAAADMTGYGTGGTAWTSSVSDNHTVSGIAGEAVDVTYCVMQDTVAKIN